MREAELTSELLVAMAAGLQDKKKSVDSYYRKWDDRFPYKWKATARFRDVIDLIQLHLGEQLTNSNFRRPALFYSLFLAVYELRYGVLGDFASLKRGFGGPEARRLSRAVAQLDEVLEAEVPPKQYLPFVSACQRQTDNINPRSTRHHTILREFANTR